MSTSSKISVEQRGHVLLIGINRPDKYNGFDLEMWDALSAAYGRLHNDDTLRCGLVFGHGKHFSAGLELPKWTDAFASGAWPTPPAGHCDPLGLQPDYRCKKPLVFAIHGICYTIGIELMLAGDIRVAARDTRFGQIEPARGIYAVGGATTRFIQNIGWGNAQRYLLTADEFDGDAAYRMGLVQELTEPGEQFDAALAIAERIAAQAPLAVQASLRSSRLMQDQLEQVAVQQFMPDVAPLMSSEDAAEGVASFNERRQAQFVGR